MPYVRRGSIYRRRRGLGSLTSTQQQIVTAANSAGIDPSLALAVAQQESGFNPNATSSAGAIGLFQLMPATAASLGVNPSDPSQNIQGGITYLANLLQQYGGDVESALWAYNAGPTNEANGIMPPQTQAYIPAVESLQSTWNQVLGTSPASISSPSPAPTPSTPDLNAIANAITGSPSDSGDQTMMYVGLGLAGLAGLLLVLNLR